MSPKEWRVKKRLGPSVPLELSKLQDPNAAGWTIIEGVCPVGAWDLARQAMESTERLAVRLLELNLRTQGRVICWRRLPDGRDWLGLPFQEMSMSKWTEGFFDGVHESSLSRRGQI
jgi:hypothetical protein